MIALVFAQTCTACPIYKFDNMYPIIQSHLGSFEVLFKTEHVYLCTGAQAVFTAEGKMSNYIRYPN